MIRGRKKKNSSILALFLAFAMVFSLISTTGKSVAKAGENTGFTLYYYYEGSESLYVDIWNWTGLGLAADTVYAADPLGWGKDLGQFQAVNGNENWYSMDFEILDSSAGDGFDLYAGTENVLKIDSQWNNTDLYAVLVSGDNTAYAYTGDGLTGNLSEAGLTFQEEDETVYSDGSLLNGDFSTENSDWILSWDQELTEDPIFYKTDEWLTDPENQFLHFQYYPSGSDAAFLSASQSVKNLSGTYTLSLESMGDEGAANPLDLTITDSQGEAILSMSLSNTTGWNSWVEDTTPEFTVPDDGKITISFSGAFLNQYVDLDNVALISTSEPEVKRTFDLDTAVVEHEAVDSDLYVEKVDLMNDFATGFDLSSYPAIKASGAVYKDQEGNELDDAAFFAYLAENGVNYVRIRCWVDPYDADGNPYGGGNCTVDTVKTIGRLATDAGMRVLVDFHYSDFWTDPGKYNAPKAWADLDLAAKAETLKQYTIDSLQAILDAGVDVGMVQVGNETTSGFCGEKNWTNMCTLFQAGSEAIQEVEKANDKSIMIVIHFTNPEKGNCASWAKTLETNKVVYDVFATSYYPYWHGTLDNLLTQLSTVAETYDKYVMVAETSYVHTLEDGDGHENTESKSKLAQDTFPYDISLQGQALAIRNVTDVVASVPENKGIGVFWWEPAWIPVQHYDATAENAGEVLAQNRALWEEFGSGWATSYSGEYISDAVEWYGGSAVDNEGVFDFDGQALPTVEIYNMIRGGSGEADYLVGLQDVKYTIEEGDEVYLPGTVTAIYASGKEEKLSVSWDADKMKESLLSGIGEYEIPGTVELDEEEYTVWYYLTILPANLLLNPGMEESDMSMWDIDHSYPSRKSDSDNTRTGNYTLHFWSDTAPVAFTVSQTVTLEKGYYKAGTYFETNPDSLGDGIMTFYVQLGEEEPVTEDIQAKGWGNWVNPEIEWFYVPEDGTPVTVGVTLENGAAGAWGAFDDWYLNVYQKLDILEEKGTHRYGLSEDASYVVDLADPAAIEEIILNGEILTEADYSLETEEGNIRIILPGDSLKELSWGETKSDSTDYDLQIRTATGYADAVLTVLFWPFTDVTNPASWYFDNVDYVYQNGIMTGDKAKEGAQTTFRPLDNITRAEFVTMLYKFDTMLNGEEPTIYSCSSPFTDVINKDAYYYDPVLWAYANGIVVGYEAADGTRYFGRRKEITRAEIAEILRKYAENILGYDLEYDTEMDFSSFTDASAVRNWRVEPMAFAVTFGIISGIEDKTNHTFTLAPDGKATRAQTAAMIQRFIENVITE